MKTCLCMLAVGLAGLLVACGGETEPASNIQPTSATLNVKGRCAFPSSGTWRFQYRVAPAGAWQNGPSHGFACPSGSNSTTNVPLPGDNITGLTPGTTYQFRLAADLDPQEGDYAFADSLGVTNGTDYDTFTTPENCDDTQTAGESLSAFISSNPAGTAGNRQVLCVRGGTQDIGQQGLGAYQTLRGPSSNQLNGNIHLEEPGATLEDLKIVGCLGTPGCTSNRDKIVDVKDNDVTVRRVDVGTATGRNSQSIQCMLIGSATNRPTGLLVEYSKFHGCGTDTASDEDKEHGIYCGSADTPRFLGNWLYDNEGWGFHLYPDCDNAVVEGSVAAQNGNACVNSGEAPVATTGVIWRWGFCGFATQRVNDSDLPIHCYSTTSGNQAVDMVLYDPDIAQVTDCGSSLTQTNTLNADPVFVNRTGFDFRVTAAGARTRMRQYADNQPGPRW